jgi:hypothetical protein
VKRFQPRSDAFVNQPGEEAGIDDELAPFRIESRGRLGRDGLVARPPCFFSAATLSRMATSMSRNSLSSALLLTGLPCPGMMTVSLFVAARLASDAAIMPSMLPPVNNR